MVAIHATNTRVKDPYVHQHDIAFQILSAIKAGETHLYADKRYIDFLRSFNLLKFYTEVVEIPNQFAIKEDGIDPNLFWAQEHKLNKA